MTLQRLLRVRVHDLSKVERSPLAALGQLSWRITAYGASVLLLYVVDISICCTFRPPYRDLDMLTLTAPIRKSLSLRYQRERDSIFSLYPFPLCGSRCRVYAKQREPLCTRGRDNIHTLQT